MKNKYIFISLLSLSFLCIVYLIYISTMDKNIYTFLFPDSLNIFFFLVSLFCFFYITFLLLLREKQKVAILSKTIQDKDKMIAIQDRKFEQKLSSEINLLKQKDKLIYEDLKIVSMKELIINISHQYRQPLSMISTAASALKLYNERKALDEKKLNESCTIVDENVQYLSSILDSFDSFNKVKKEKFLFKLSSLRYRFLSYISMHKEFADIDISFDIKEDISVKSFKNEIIQILLNIINNSREAFRRKDIKEKYIHIKIDMDDTHFNISIKDNAGGIDEHIIHRIFEPYFTTKHQAQGVGLGLYISYVLVRQRLGGEVSVQNTSEGCEFLVRVPKT